MYLNYSTTLIILKNIRNNNERISLGCSVFGVSKRPDTRITVFTVVVEMTEGCVDENGGVRDRGSTWSAF